MLLVSMSPRCRVVSAKKVTLRTKNGSKSAFSGVQGEFFRGNSSGEALVGELIRGGAAGAVVLGELFRGRVAGGAVLGEFCRDNRYCAGLGCSAVHFRLAAVGVLQH